MQCRADQYVQRHQPHPHEHISALSRHRGFQGCQEKRSSGNRGLSNQQHTRAHQPDGYTRPSNKFTHSARARWRGGSPSPAAGPPRPAPAREGTKWLVVEIRTRAARSPAEASLQYIWSSTCICPPRPAPAGMHLLESAENRAATEQRERVQRVPAVDSCSTAQHSRAQHSTPSAPACGCAAAWMPAPSSPGGRSGGRAWPLARRTARPAGCARC